MRSIALRWWNTVRMKINVGISIFWSTSKNLSDKTLTIQSARKVVTHVSHKRKEPERCKITVKNGLGS